MSTPFAGFAGGLRALPPEGQQTGMFKAPVVGPVAVGVDGLAGDRQADRRVHGGPEKAVHYFPAEHYAHLTTRVPALADALRPGVLGENLSALGLTEDTVCIGDVFAAGSCRLQVSQPRNPCWKINHRLDHDRMSRIIVDDGCTGWYFRVLAPGVLTAGEVLRLVERPAPGMTLARLAAVKGAHRPSPDELLAVAAAPGLAPDVARRLQARGAWLTNSGVPPC